MHIATDLASRNRTVDTYMTDLDRKGVLGAGGKAGTALLFPVGKLEGGLLDVLDRLVVAMDVARAAQVCAFVPRLKSGLGLFPL